MIYLDNASTTRVAPEVFEAMKQWLTERYGNAGSLHKLGREASDAIEKARGHVAALLGCSPQNIIFTSGGTEGNNLIVKGVRNHLESIGKRHLVVSSIEHESLLKAVETLVELGFDVTYINPDSNGRITLDAVKDAVKHNTGFVSVMFTNNETGVTNNIAEISQFCIENDILFHSDMVQSAGHRELIVEHSGISFATISSHKIHGPQGMGAVYVRDTSLLQPIIAGGSGQEFGLRGGTENVAGIVGFGEACRIAREEMTQNQLIVGQAKNDFVRTLIGELPGEDLKEKGIRFNFSSHMHAGKVLNIKTDGVFGETLVLMLDAMGIYISAGSACNSHEDKPSRVLLAHGLSEEDARCSVRVSFSKFNSTEEVTAAAIAMAGCIKTLRSAALGREVEDGVKNS